MCRIGGRLRDLHASVEGVDVEIPPFLYFDTNPTEGGRQCVVGSLTGVVASERVTEACKGTLSMVGNHAKSILV
jgi:hypothetical protein